MSAPEPESVRVATCHDPAEATVIGTALAAHGIDAMIPHGASSAGVAAVGFVTHVFVHPDDAEEATALIAMLRAAPMAELGDDDALGEETDEDRALAAAPDVAVVVERRKRVGATVLFALVLTFGSGHMSTGAWKRGIALAAVEIVGLRHAFAGNRLGLVAVVGAVLVDLVGALARARARGVPALPVAQLRGSRSRDRR